MSGRPVKGQSALHSKTLGAVDHRELNSRVEQHRALTRTTRRERTPAAHCGTGALVRHQATLKEEAEAIREVAHRYTCLHQRIDGCCHTKITLQITAVAAENLQSQKLGIQLRLGPNYWCNRQI